MARFAVSVSAGVLICIGLAPTLRSQSPPRQGIWAEKARLGEQRTEAGATVVDGKLYVLGGGARGQDAYALNQEYDLDTDAWRERAPMPAALSHAGVVTLNGRIYVVGGFLRNVHADAQPTFLEYDPRADTWRTLPSMKSPRGSVGVAAVDGKIHAIGGRDVNRLPVNTHEVFDLRTGGWTDLPPLPQARDHTFTVAVEREIHVIGGRLNSTVENVNTHDIFDTMSRTWKVGPPLPTPRSGGGAVLYRGSIVVLGGECSNGRPFAQNEALDVKTNRWSTLAPMPSGRHGMIPATDGRTVFVAGGSPACGGGGSDTLMTFRLP